MTVPDSPPARDEPRRRLDPADRKREILTAAYDVFAEVGYKAASIRAIAERAGVTKGLVLFYFKRKEEIFEAVVSDILPQVLAETETLMRDAEGTHAEQLTAVMRAIYGGLVGRPEFGVILRILVSEGRTFPTLVDVYYRRIVRWSGTGLGAILERGVADGAFADMDRDYLTRVLLGPPVMAMFWQNLFADYRTLDTDRLFDTQIELILNGLRPRI